MPNEKAHNNANSKKTTKIEGKKTSKCQKTGKVIVAKTEHNDIEKLILNTVKVKVAKSEMYKTKIDETLKEQLLINYNNNTMSKSCYTIEIPKDEKMPHEIELEKKKDMIKDLICR